MYIVSWHNFRYSKPSLCPFYGEIHNKPLVTDTLLGSRNQYFTQSWVSKLSIKPIIGEKLETLSVSEPIAFNRKYTIKSCFLTQFWVFQTHDSRPISLENTQQNPNEILKLEIGNFSCVTEYSLWQSDIPVHLNTIERNGISWNNRVITSILLLFS